MSEIQKVVLAGARSNRPDSHARPHNSADGGHLKSRVTKRSLVVGHHKTSVSLEDVFWYELRAIAQAQGVPLSDLVGHIDAERQHGNLSSAIRLFVFEQRCCRQIDGAANGHGLGNHSPPQK